MSDCRLNAHSGSHHPQLVLGYGHLTGRDSMPSTAWDREPFPVTDLKFDLRSENGFGELSGNPSIRGKTFKVYPRSMLERGMRLLSEALPGSWLEIRNYRRDVLTLTQAGLTQETAAEVHRFLLAAPPSMTRVQGPYCCHHRPVFDRCVAAVGIGAEASSQRATGVWKLAIHCLC